MKDQNEPNEEPLLDAALADEGWQSFSASLRSQAIESFRAGQRRKRWRRLSLGAGLVALCLGGLVRLGQRPTPERQVVAHHEVVETVPSEPDLHYISEEEMLEAFPPGSCVLVEMHGMKQLVFLDEDLAAAGFPVESDRDKATLNSEP